LQVGVFSIERHIANSFRVRRAGRAAGPSHKN
jgi:hypothetical protein